MRTVALLLALWIPSGALAGDAPAEEVIGQLLQERIELGFEATPLGQALDLIQDAVWLNVVVSPQADAAEPLSLPSAERSVGELISAIERTHDLEHQIYCDVLYLHPRGAPPTLPEPEPVASALPGYTFRFRGEPLRDALDLILDLAGLSLVVPEPLAEELEQPVRLRARNLPLHHALTLITDRAGLSWAKDGDAIRLTRPPRDKADPPKPAPTKPQPATPQAAEANKPAEPKPAEPAPQPAEPAPQPAEPAPQPAEPAPQPAEPAPQPTEPAEPAPQPSEAPAETPAPQPEGDVPPPGADG